MKLRRDSHVALHRQLAQQLRSAINLGTYKTGDRIPAEPALALRHGVSRVTARQAVMQLAKEKLVVRRQGKGTFVAEPPVHHDLLDPHGIFDELVAKGVNPRTELLELAERVAPFALSWVWLAPWLPKLSREQIAQNSSYHLFRGPLNIKVANADLSIRARAATLELRRVLRLRGAIPITSSMQGIK